MGMANSGTCSPRLCRPYISANMRTERHPDDLTAQIQGETYTTIKAIAAIEASPLDLIPIGPVTQLPGFTSVTVVSPGFHDSLVKVRAEESMYFVFAEDLLLAANASGRATPDPRA